MWIVNKILFVEVYLLFLLEIWLLLEIHFVIESFSNQAFEILKRYFENMICKTLFTYFTNFQSRWHSIQITSL